MPSYLETWDPSVPAGSRDISLGDDDLRSMKRALTERLGEDHEFQTDETGNNKIGYHKKVTFSPRTGDPTTVTGCGILYSKDVGSGVIELFYQDAAGNILQVTSAGSLKALSKEVKMWFGTVASIPTGWYLCNGSGSRPDLRDRFIVGAFQDSAGVAMSTVTGSLSQSASPTHNHGGTSGATTLTIAQIPAHTHGIHNSAGGGGGGGDLTNLQKTDNTNLGSINTDSTGGSTSHDHSISAVAAIPPFFALAYISQYNQ